MVAVGVAVSSGLSGIAWLLFIRVVGEPAPKQYGPFTSEHACVEAGEQIKKDMGNRLLEYNCFAS